MSDAVGIVQFVSAVGELARGAEAPSVQPVWQRHLLSARNPPRVTCTHHEFDTAVPDTEERSRAPPDDNMVERGFFFSAADISAFRSSLPSHLLCSSFDIAVACTWRCRAIALSLDPSAEIRISCMVNCRSRFDPPLPEGYYGNAFVYPATAERLAGGSLEYALESVRDAKSQATEEYVKSVADLMVMSGRPVLMAMGTYLVSDVTRAGFGEVDYGWGPAAYGGPAECTICRAPGALSFVVACNNRKGEKGIAG